MDKLIHACVAYLEIQRPIDIRFVTRLKYKGWHAYHTTLNKGDKILKHVIKVSLAATFDSRRDVDTVIAHEFVHAWQAEYAPKSAMHGKVFAEKAFELRARLITDGFDIGEDIYDAEIDK